jgi:hypothetical protein
MGIYQQQSPEVLSSHLLVRSGAFSTLNRMFGDAVGASHE